MNTLLSCRKIIMSKPQWRDYQSASCFLSKQLVKHVIYCHLTWLSLDVHKIIREYYIVVYVNYKKCDLYAHSTILYLHCIQFSYACQEILFSCTNYYLSIYIMGYSTILPYVKLDEHWRLTLLVIFTIGPLQVSIMRGATWLHLPYGAWICTDIVLNAKWM